MLALTLITAKWKFPRNSSKKTTVFITLILMRQDYSLIIYQFCVCGDTGDDNNDGDDEEEDREFKREFKIF